MTSKKEKIMGFFNSDLENLEEISSLLNPRLLGRIANIELLVEYKHHNGKKIRWREQDYYVLIYGYEEGGTGVAIFNDTQIIFPSIWAEGLQNVTGETLLVNDASHYKGVYNSLRRANIIKATDSYRHSDGKHTYYVARVNFT